jgi:hypothetical protein
MSKISDAKYTGKIFDDSTCISVSISKCEGIAKNMEKVGEQLISYVLIV